MNLKTAVELLEISLLDIVFLFIYNTIINNLSRISRMQYQPPWSRGLGRLPFTEETGIRIPLGVDKFFRKH